MTGTDFFIIVVGLGKMGAPMARHLAAAGHRVQGVETDPRRAAQLRAEGLPVAASLEQALAHMPAGQCVVVSSLPHDAALLQVGAEVARLAPAGTVYLDTSTVSLQASADVAALLADAGVDYLRATVSGNAQMAEQARLTVMVSGPREVYDRLGGVFACWGGTAFYLGQDEQARLMKLVVNLMVAATSAMLAESLSLGQRGGLSWDDMWTVISASAVGAPIVQAKRTALAAHDYTPTFTVEQMRKDVGLIAQAGQSLDVPLPLLALVQQSLSAASAQGDGDLDYAAVIRVAQRAAGLL